jgi:hypothetical protein
VIRVDERHLSSFLAEPHVADHNCVDRAEIEGCDESNTLGFRLRVFFP